MTPPFEIMVRQKSRPTSERRAGTRVLIVLGMAAVALAAVAAYVAREAQAIREGAYAEAPQAVEEEFDPSNVRTKYAPAQIDPANLLAVRNDDGWVKRGVTVPEWDAGSAVDLRYQSQPPGDLRPIRQFMYQQHPGTSLHTAIRACSLEHLSGTGWNTCRYDLKLRIAMTAQGTGEVVGTQVSPGTDEFGEETAVDATCEPFAQCVASRGWIGMKTPMPSSAGDTLFLRHTFRYNKFRGTFDEYRESVEASLAQVERELQMCGRPEFDCSPSHAGMLQNLLEYYRSILEELS